MGAELRNFMARNPVRERIPFAEKILTWLKRPFPAAALASMILITGGGTAAYAAESALPGDLLYPVKTEVNDRVRVAVAFSEEDKARATADVAQERLEETEALAAKGKLDENTRAELAAQFDAGTQEVKNRIAKIAEHNADAAADLQSSLDNLIDAHRVVLASLGEKNFIAATFSSDSSMGVMARPEINGRMMKAMNAMRVSTEEKVKMSGTGAAAMVHVSNESVVKAIASAQKRLMAAQAALAQSVSVTTMSTIALPSSPGARAMRQASPSAVSQKLSEAASALFLARKQAADGVGAQARLSAQKAEKLAQQATIILQVQRDLKIAPIPAMPVNPPSDALPSSSAPSEESTSAPSSTQGSGTVEENVQNSVDTSAGTVNSTVHIEHHVQVHTHVNVKNILH